MRCWLAPLLFVLPWAAQAEAVSARLAQHALAQGAVAWDVRAAPAALVPGAVQADLRAWQSGGGLAALEQAVSAAGIDLSRDVVLYGAAGDPLAQSLLAALRGVASGQVHWLVGGIEEWQAAGLPTRTQATPRLPVPQHLVSRGRGEGGAPAAATLRRAGPATLLSAGL